MSEVKVNLILTSDIYNLYILLFWISMFEFEDLIHLAHLSNVWRGEDQYLLRRFAYPRSTRCQPVYAVS
jgi:hypothetical protein